MGLIQRVATGLTAQVVSRSNYAFRKGKVSIDLHD